jgi:citrate lyase subunit beta/citryl-CoA lyase
MSLSDVLFQSRNTPIFLPACDHYAGSEKLIKKSLAIQQELGPVFDITCDCEDGATVGNEAAHAELLGHLIASSDNRFNRVGIRVHDLRHPVFEQDLKTVFGLAAQQLAYVVVPKSQSLADAQEAVAIIDRVAADHGRDNIPVHFIIESSGSLREVFPIAALAKVQCLSFGIMDFVSSHDGAIPSAAMQSPLQFTHPLVTRAKVEIAAACQMYGKVASHNVTTDLSDMTYAAADATRAASEFGYRRMWSIHPRQIKHILEAFTPLALEIDEATGILSKAINNAWGPIKYDNRLHDRASFRYYWGILQRAKASGIELSEATSLLLLS